MFESLWDSARVTSSKLDKRKDSKGNLREQAEGAFRRSVSLEKLNNSPPEAKNTEDHFGRNEKRKRNATHDQPCAVSPRHGMPARDPAACDPGHGQHDWHLDGNSERGAQMWREREDAYRSKNEPRCEGEREISESSF